MPRPMFTVKNRTSDMPKPIDLESTRDALDSFGDQIAALGSDTANRVMQASYLAVDTRIPHKERAFANEQANAIKRAIHCAIVMFVLVSSAV